MDIISLAVNLVRISFYRMKYFESQEENEELGPLEDILIRHVTSRRLKYSYWSGGYS